MDLHKRQYRRLKRSVKQAGNRKRRRYWKRTLERDPQAAAEAEFAFGRDGSAGLNGMDRDVTRRQRDT